MLPTKGYFQDIECPYYDSSCGRPYCHFRHRKKTTEIIEGVVSEPEKEENQVIPTYKPTPKSELANIHNSKSHIPISYVPDLAFRPDRKSRPTPKFEKPTYKPTPLSILSSANKRGSSICEENGEHTEAIKEIKQNIANVEYNPAISLQPAPDIIQPAPDIIQPAPDIIQPAPDIIQPAPVIDFEQLSPEFDLIDEIINSNDKLPKTNVETENNEHAIAANTAAKISTSNKNDSQVKEKNQTGDHFSKQEFKNLERKEDKNITHSKSNSTKISYKLEKQTEKKEKKEENSTPRKSEKEEKIERHGDKKEKHKSTEKLSEKYKKSDRNKSDRSSVSSEKSVKSKSTKDRDKVEQRKCSEKEKPHSQHKHSSKERTKDKNKKSKNERVHKSSTREDHRKEEKKDRNEEKVSGKSIHKNLNKSKRRSRDRSKSKERSRSKHREKETEREKHKDKVKDKQRCDNNKTDNFKNNKDNKRGETYNRKDTKKYKDVKDNKSSKYKKEKHKVKDSDESSGHDSDTTDTVEQFLPSVGSESLDNNTFSDVDLDDDEDETMLECYKIFNEYQPPPPASDKVSNKNAFIEEFTTWANDINELYSGRKRVAHPNLEHTVTYSQLHPPNKPKTISTPGQTLTNRYKLAKLAQANKEQEFIMHAMTSATSTKRPAPTLLEAARERKIRREQERIASSSTGFLVDDIIKGTAKTAISQPKVAVRKIAPAQNVGLIEKAKERISKIKQAAQVKTVAHTQKSNRVAHVPEVSLSDIPDVLQADKSKLPVNVRTRFLTMIADECTKLYISKEEAFSRALNEEFSCYEKCKVLATYRNSAMLAVNRLRKEIQERDKLGLGLIGLGEDSGRDPSSQFKGRNFYDNIKKWILTEDELDIHGYPRESEETQGRVIIKNVRNVLPKLDENQRMCSRCHKIYQVDDDGWPLYEEECLYHPLKKRTIRGEQTYLCCRSNDSTGCATSDSHVSEAANDVELEGYQTTMEAENADDPRNYAVYALDCEMCYTTKGLELTRVTVVDSDCKTVYESLVKPLNPIIDYNTRFSGITKEQMDRTSTSILQVQANILHLCNSQTILMGHSLESDMKALKIVHGTIIDTAVLFPHKMGLPHKRALKALASEYLRKIIQNEISGHDSAEDAVTCMELIKWKLKDELKLRVTK